MLQLEIINYILILLEQMVGVIKKESVLVLLIGLICYCNCQGSSLPVTSHQLFLIPNDFTGAKQSFAYTLTLPDSYDMTWNRFWCLGGFQVYRDTQIKINISLSAYVSPNSATVNMWTVQNLIIWEVSIFMLFVQQGTTLIPYVQNIDHKCVYIDTFDGPRTQSFSVALPSTIMAPAAVDISYYLAGFDTVARVSERNQVMVDSAILDGSGNNINIALSLSTNHQKVNAINLLLLVVDNIVGATLQVSHYDHSFTILQNSLLTPSSFSVVPSQFYNSPYGGYDGWCLFGIKDLQFSGNSLNNFNRSIFFDITSNSSIFVDNFMDVAYSVANLHWKCLRTCPNSTYWSAGTCLSCQSNCVLCVDGTSCDLCADTYGWSGGACNLCTDMNAGCSLCINNTYCTACINSTYGLDGSNMCVLCDTLMANCDTCSNDSTCLTCINSTYAINSTNQCQIPPCTLLFCSTCLNGTHCQSCINSSYLPLSGTCTLCGDIMTGCWSCSSLVYCDICIAGVYILNASNLCQSDCPTNCANCTSSSYCLECTNDSYTLSSNLCQLCSVTMPNCLTCLSTLHCLTCASNFGINYPNVSCQACSMIIPSCLDCTDNTNCLNCSTNSILINGSCTLCSSILNACSVCTNSTYCTICLNSSYVLNSSNLCEISCMLPGCATCSGIGMCSACVNDTYVLDNLNQCQLCTISMSNCSTCSNLSTCLTCDNTYTLNSTTSCLLCSTSLTNCLNCDNLTHCTACVDLQHTITANNTCEVCSTLMSNCFQCSNPTACTTCSNTTYVVNSSLQCQLCSDLIYGCQICSNYTDCITCLINFYLNSSLSICQQCISVIQNCYSCNSSLYCTQCYSLLYFVNPLINCTDCSYCQLCSNATGSCLTCLSPTHCLSCLNDSFGISGVDVCDPCYDLISNCELCINSSYCKQCVNDSYYLTMQNVLCLPCYTSLPNCQTCQGSSICLSCASVTHYVDQISSCSLCQAVLPNCLECSVAIGVSSSNCTLCATNFLINSGLQCQSCSVYMPNCVDCVVNNYCDRCLSFHGFDPQSNSCLPCAAIYPNCFDCNNSQCIQCPDEMKMVQGYQGCQCILGWLVSGLCTTIVGCIQPVIYADNSKGCQACDPSVYHLQPVDDVCDCLVGVLLQETCNTVPGCIVALTVSKCRFCDSPEGFLMTPDGAGQCICRTLLERNMSTCIDICGDGLLAKRANNNCDDGNMIEGDGCSSKCQVETSYKCQNGSTTTASQCVYAGIPIILKEKRVERSEGLNQGFFTFDVEAPLLSIARMNMTRYIDFICDAQYSVSQITYQDGVLKVVADYSTDMENKACNITMSFDPLIISSVSYTLSFTAVSKTSPLTISTQLDTYTTFNTVFLYFSYAVLLAFLLSLGHKMIGAELLFSCQIVYFSCGLYQQPPLLTTSIGKFKAVTGSLFFYDENYQHLFEPFTTQVEISPFFLENVLFPTLLLLLFFITWITLTVVKAFSTSETQPPKRLKNKRTNDPSLLVKAPRFLFSVFLFPLTAGFLAIIILSVYLNSSRITPDAEGSFPRTLNSLASLLVWLIAGFVVGVQFIFPCVSKNEMQNSEVVQMGGLEGAKVWYIPMFVVRLVLAVCGLLFYTKEPGLWTLGLILGPMLLYFVMMLIYRPYHRVLDNVGMLLCEVQAIYALSLAALSYLTTLQEQIQMFLIMGLIILISVSLILSLIRTLVKLVHRCRKRATEKDQLSSKVQKESKLMEEQRHTVRYIHDSPERKNILQADFSKEQTIKHAKKGRRKKLLTEQHPKRKMEQDDNNLIEDEMFKATKQRLREDFLTFKKNRNRFLPQA